MITIFNRLGTLLSYYDFEYAEAISGLAAVGFALWFGNPILPVDVGISRVLLDMMPRYQWVLLTLATGLVQLHGLLMNEFSSRRFGALMAFMLWIFLAVLAFLSRGPGFPLYFVFGLAIGWAYLRMYRRSASG